MESNIYIHFINCIECKNIKVLFYLNKQQLKNIVPCDKMAKESMKQTRLLVNNPREVSEEDAFNIYSASW